MQFPHVCNLLSNLYLQKILYRFCLKFQRQLLEISAVKFKEQTDPDRKHNKFYV